MLRYFKLIPALLLVGLVIYFSIVFSVGIRSAINQINQIITLKDINSIMREIEKHYLTFNKIPNNQELRVIIEESVIIKNRLWGAKEPWKDIWGTPFLLTHSPEGKIVLQSAGPDKVFSHIDPLSQEAISNTSLLGDDVALHTSEKAIIEKYKQNSESYFNTSDSQP